MSIIIVGEGCQVDNKFIKGVFIGAVVGGAISLLDKQARNDAKKLVTEPIDTCEQVIQLSQQVQVKSEEVKRLVSKS